MGRVVRIGTEGTYPSMRVHTATLHSALNRHVTSPELRLFVALIMDTIATAKTDATSAVWLAECSSQKLADLEDAGFENLAQRLEDVVEEILEDIDVPQLETWKPENSLVCEICGRFHFPRSSAKGRSTRRPKTCGRPSCATKLRARNIARGHARRQAKYTPRTCPICGVTFRTRGRESNPDSKHYRKTCGDEACRRGLISRTRIANARERRNRTREDRLAVLQLED